MVHTLGNPWIRDCMEIVHKNKNVHADVSDLVLGDFKSHFKKSMLQQLKEMNLCAGEPRYLRYGADWPICRMRTYLRFVNELGLTRKSESWSVGRTPHNCSSSTSPSAPTL